MTCRIGPSHEARSNDAYFDVGKGSAIPGIDDRSDNAAEGRLRWGSNGGNGNGERDRERCKRTRTARENEFHANLLVVDVEKEWCARFAQSGGPRLQRHDA